MFSECRSRARACALFALLTLACAGAQAQEGLLLYVPNSGSNTVSVFRTNADGSLTAVTTLSGFGAATQQALVRGDQAFAYVTSSTGDQVHVINAAAIGTATNPVTTTGGLDGASGVTIAPDGKTVYVATQDANTVTIFRADPRTGQLTNTGMTIAQAVNSRPRGLAITPDGSRLVVVNQGNTVAAVPGSVVVFDITNPTNPTNPVTVGGPPMGQLTNVTINPGGTRAYVVDADSARVHVIDMANPGAAPAVITTGAGPRSVAVSPDGSRLYVTSRNDQQVEVYNAATGALVQEVGVQGASGLALSRDGRFLYATGENGLNQVVLFSVAPDTGLLTAGPGIFGTGANPFHPGLCGGGSTLLAAGNTFVANTGAAFSCASLAGSIVVNGTLLTNGAAIGTMPVSRSFVFNPGSTLVVRADAAGNADRMDITGTLTLNGGTVEVQAVPGNYRKATSYTILTASGGVSGAFSGATSSLPFLTASLFYDANNVYLGLVRNETTFASVAQTPNQRAVAAYLDAVAGSPGAVDLANSLDTLSATQAREAFTSMNGNGLSAPARVVMAGSANFTDLLAMKVDPASARKVAFAPVQVAQLGATGVGEPKPGESRGVWLRVRGLRGDQEGSDNASGYEFDAIGLAGGFDAALNPDTQLGVAFSYTRTPVTLHGGAGDSLVRSPQAAVYGLRAFGPLQLKGVLGAGWHDIETKRNVTIGSATSVASGEHKGNEWFAYGEANYGVKLRGGSEIRPLAGLRYIRLQEEDYAEQGSAAALVVAERTTESITPLLGLRYLQPFNLERGRFEMRAVWSYEAGDANPSISGRLATSTSGATFTAQGAPISRNALTLGLGVENEVVTRCSLYGDYNVELREGQTIHAFTAGVRYAW